MSTSQVRLTPCGCFHRKPRFSSPPSLPTLSVGLHPGRSVTKEEQVEELGQLHAAGRRRSTARKRSHLSGEHGDVVEISLTSLFDGQREEEPAPVLREQRLLSLHRQTQLLLSSFNDPKRRKTNGNMRSTCRDSQVSDESSYL